MVNSIMALQPVVLLADAGVPMIVFTWPGMLVLLLPIIAVETLFILKYTHLPHRKVVWATASANAVSTVVGIPLTWAILFACELGLWGEGLHTPIITSRENSPLAQIVTTILTAPWLRPVGKSERWTIPLAALVLLIPFLFVSVWVEQQVMNTFFRVPNGERIKGAESDENTLRKAVWGANALSYGLLFMFVVVWLLWFALHH